MKLIYINIKFYLNKTKKIKLINKKEINLQIDRWIYHVKIKYFNIKIIRELPLFLQINKSIILFNYTIIRKIMKKIN